jgi:Na+/alanine symporter
MTPGDEQRFDWRRGGAAAVALVATLVLLGMVVLVAHAEKVPSALALIFQTAFTGTAAVGGFTGAAMIAAIRYGVARGIFSNEAGLGTAGIAQAAGMSNDPVRAKSWKVATLSPPVLIHCEPAPETVAVGFAKPPPIVPT